tara:strand:+ start:122 stop:709 length:588 start_codon:yes stop_codon:yes gene_type:complete
MATTITQQEINDFIQQNGIADLLRLIANASNGTVESVEQIQHADEHTQREIAVAISTPPNAKQAAKLAAKEKKDAEKAEAKAKKDQEKAEAKAKKDAEKLAAKEAAKAQKLAAKEAAKAQKLAAKAHKDDQNDPAIVDTAPLLHDHAAPLLQHDALVDNTNTPHTQYDILVIDHNPSNTLITNQFIQSPADSESE